MTKCFGSSRNLLVMVALAVVAALCIVSPAQAASSASAGRMSTSAPHAPAASARPCHFVGTLNTCKSTTPTAAYYDSVHGDTSQCTFVFHITWGDRSSTTKTVTDPTPGHHLVGKHIYTRPKAYTITVTVKVAAGNCTGTNSVHTFKLLVAKKMFPVPAGKAHVKKHVVHNYRVRGKKVSAALISTSCALAIAKFDIIHAVVESVVAFVPTGWGKVAVLILATVYDGGELLNACVPTKLKYHVK
jgi:hypothetical protein